MKKKTLLTLLLIVGAISTAILFYAHNQDVLLHSEVDAPEVIVASKANGGSQTPDRAWRQSEGRATVDPARPMNGTREESIHNLPANLS